jgi:hypothetical protein
MFANMTIRRDFANTKIAIFFKPKILRSVFFSGPPKLFSLSAHRWPEKPGNQRGYFNKKLNKFGMA